MDPEYSKSYFRMVMELMQWLKFKVKQEKGYRRCLLDFTDFMDKKYYEHSF